MSTNTTTTPKSLNKTKSFRPLWLNANADNGTTAPSTTTTLVDQHHPCAFVRVNPGVPMAATTKTNTQGGGGRVVMYEPVLTFSPVYASSRRLSTSGNGSSNNNKKKRSLINDAQMHDLVQSLEHMMMVQDDDETKQEEDENDDHDDETKNNDTGRFEQTVTSPAKGTVTVKRSRRLSSSSDKM